MSASSTERADAGRRWVQETPTEFGRSKNALFGLISQSAQSYRIPSKCLHLHRRWRGGFNWDCLDCGEAVRDREDKTQTTFSSTLYTETP